jgi:hypothetical protein
MPGINIMLSVAMLSVAMLSVVMLNVIILSVVVPLLYSNRNFGSHSGQFYATWVNHFYAVVISIATVVTFVKQGPIILTQWSFLLPLWSIILTKYLFLLPQWLNFLEH